MRILSIQNAQTSACKPMQGFCETAVVDLGAENQCLQARVIRKNALLEPNKTSATGKQFT